MTTPTVDDELVAQILAALPPIKHDPIPDRGFMLQGAENAYADIGRLVEDAAWTLLERGDSDATVVIEAYTIRQRRSHLPHADDLCVYLEECAADNEACENVEYGRSPAVLALAEALAQRMSNEGNGWMCDEQTATHIVTLAGRQPILDGEPWGEPLPDPDVPRLSSYPILPPATRVRIRNRLTRSLEAVNELLTSARDNAHALDQAAAELDPESMDYLELKGAADFLAGVALEARANRDAITARRNYWPTEAGEFGD